MEYVVAFGVIYYASYKLHTLQYKVKDSDQAPRTSSLKDGFKKDEYYERRKRLGDFEMSDNQMRREGIYLKNRSTLPGAVDPVGDNLGHNPLARTIKRYNLLAN